MTLSWSPGFCDLGGQDTSSPRMRGRLGRRLRRPRPLAGQRLSPEPRGLPFGPGRDARRSRRRARPLSRTTASRRYEYRKHGTCTGLSAHDYFATVRNVRERLNIPAMLQAPHQQLHLARRATIEQAFIAANANLASRQHGGHLQHGELVDVRFCLAKDLCPSRSVRRSRGTPASAPRSPSRRCGERQRRRRGIAPGCRS